MKMMKQYRSLYFIAILVAVLVSAPPSGARTDLLDVVALRDIYKALNKPQQLTNWGLDGDPCRSWFGGVCANGSVVHLEIAGLNLSGYLSAQISNLYGLTVLNVSSNNISGTIPVVLPRRANYIDLSCNNFKENIPPSLSGMIYLKTLNVSVNYLSGPIGNVFTGLQNLRVLDLSYNNFTGDLPSSFGSLTNLTGLFLQYNKLTGSVAYLAELPLIDLNIQCNFFSGGIPSHFRYIKHLLFDLPEGNVFQPPPPPPTQDKSSPSTESVVHKKKRLTPVGLALMIGGGTLVVSCVAFYIMYYIKLSRAHNVFPSASRSSHTFTVLNTGSPKLPLNLFPSGGCSSHDSHSSTNTGEGSPILELTPQCTFPLGFKYYTLDEAISATNSFNGDRCMGQGSLGSVYKAEFADGQISVVNKLNLAGPSFIEDKFMDLVGTLSRVKHPNIIPLLGYCVERGQHLLVYEYVRNYSLDEALHNNSDKPLSWDLRFKIAVGVAKALNYLHSLSPPVGHGNLKSANILLDEELAPHICDCGLAILRPLTSKSVELEASDDAIGGTGHIALEHGLAGFANKQSDVYAFGLVLLELLTGRKPTDSPKPKEEQLLVKWASLRLHDYESLLEMVDPAIRKTSPKTLRLFAETISLCLQTEGDQPQASVVVKSLTLIGPPMLVYECRKKT